MVPNVLCTDPMGDRLTVTLKGMQFLARVGLLPHEREKPQPIEVDVTVVCEGEVSAAHTGAAASTQLILDYRDLYAIAEETLMSGHVELLEDVALCITSKVHALGGVTSSRVAVRKPAVALPGPLDYSEVVLERDKKA